ncbi:unnamed protein product [Hymenolepis diminuta]|uniref:Nudix hydrolase domain-containing protein n=1 Tax=Hymenolepis diminuta TaxID=6216 RepID=A0A564YRH4_HYMDI|nr:unnamed protein product [Hymenolepis diminuta]
MWLSCRSVQAEQVLHSYVSSLKSDSQNIPRFHLNESCNEICFSTNERLTAASGCIYYLEVGDNDLDSAAGGGNADDGECIEVVYWPIDRIDELLTLTETKTHVSDITVLAVLWFQLHILPSL